MVLIVLPLASGLACIYAAYKIHKKLKTSKPIGYKINPKKLKNNT